MFDFVPDDEDLVMGFDSQSWYSRPTPRLADVLSESTVEGRVVRQFETNSLRSLPRNPVFVNWPSRLSVKNPLAWIPSEFSRLLPLDPLLSRSLGHHHLTSRCGSRRLPLRLSPKTLLSSVSWRRRSLPLLSKHGPVVPRG